MPIKRLYRSKKDRMIAGVCAGLADYFEIDPVLVRALFVGAVFMGGMGIVIYVLLAVITPEEGTPTTQSDSVSGEQASGPATIEEPPLHLPKMTEDRRWIFGIVILGLGVVMLLGALPQIFPWWGWTFFWPLALMGLGLYIFVHYKNK